MADMEKVKKGIWQCWLPSTEEEYATQCHDCPYYEPGITLEECMTALRTDALALLKEQEAVKPFSDDDGAYWCGSCHEDLVWHQKFCSNCGRPVLWEGR